METNNKASSKLDDKKRPHKRHVTSEEKTWRTYSKSLIEELKEKLAARRARTLGLLSEGGDSSAFCEVDTESDGLDDTSSRSHETKANSRQDHFGEDEPEAASLSETSSLSDNMEFSYFPSDHTNRRENFMQTGKISPTRQCFFTTTATECHSFSPPRSDNTTMTSAKFRFDGDTQLVSVGTECDGLNDSFLSGKLSLSNTDIPNLNLDSISLDALRSCPMEPVNKFAGCEMSLNNIGTDVDSIEATYSSAVEYFFGTSKDRPPCTFINVTKSNALSEGSDKKESYHLNEVDLPSINEKEEVVPLTTVAVLNDKNTPQGVGFIEECLKCDSPEPLTNNFIPESVDSSTITPKCSENLLSKCTVANDVFCGITTATQGAGDFKFSHNATKTTAKSFCRNLIMEAEALLSSELTLTTYKCMLEEILHIVKSDKSFYAEIDQKTIATLESAFDKNSFTLLVDQNVSSNSGNDEANFRPAKEPHCQESDITKFQRNQRLQSCLKKARLVSALQLNHDSAVTKMGKVVTKQAYDKAVREFEALVTRFATTGLNVETPKAKRSDKHPHVTTLPPFGSNRSSISSKTFIFNNKEKKDDDGKVTNNEEPKIKRSSTFVMEDNSEKVNEACSLSEISLSLKSSFHNVEKQTEQLTMTSLENKNVSHQGTKPKLETNRSSKGVDDSDSESGDSHESGFCSNQVYTSTLLTQLLDYSSQEEDVADLEDTKEHEPNTLELNGNVKDFEDPVITSYEEVSDAIKTTENEIKTQGGIIDKSNTNKNIIVSVKDDLAHEELVIYESDFETGSDSDTNIQMLDSQKTTQLDLEPSSSVSATDDGTVLLSKKGSETIGTKKDIASPKNDSLLAKNYFDSKHINKASDLATNIDNTAFCSSILIDESRESSENTKDKSNTQKLFAKKNSRQYFSQMDFSSSDDDSTDDINNELSPAEILRKRQIEQVDVKLEQLKEFAKRKRKFRYPHKKCGQSDEKENGNEVEESLLDRNQSDNQNTKVSTGFNKVQDYKDPKLLSTCLDLLTKRRKMKSDGESLTECSGVKQNNLELKDAVSTGRPCSPSPDNPKPPVLQELVETHELVESRCATPKTDILAITATSLLEIPTKSTKSSTVIQNEESCSTEFKEINRESNEFEKITDSIDLSLQRTTIGEGSACIEAQRRQMLDENIYNSSEHGPNVYVKSDSTKIDNVDQQSETVKTECFEEGFGKVPFEGTDLCKPSGEERKEVFENTSTCENSVTVEQHNTVFKASVLTNSEPKKPLSLTTSTSENREDIGSKSLADLSSKVEDIKMITCNMESYNFPKKLETHATAFDMSSSSHKGKNNKPDISASINYSKGHFTNPLKMSERDETPSTFRSNLFCNDGENNSTEDNEVENAWQAIGTVNDFYKFIFESQVSQTSAKNRYVYSVCNPDYQQFFAIRPHISSSGTQTDISMFRTSWLDKCHSLWLYNENLISLESKNVGTYNTDTNTKKISHPSCNLTQETTPGTNIQLIDRLGDLEKLLTKCAHSQEYIEKSVREILQKEQLIGLGLITTKSDDSSRTHSLPLHDVPSNCVRNTLDQISFENRHELTNAATQTLDVVSQACQTEDAFYTEAAIDLKHSLQSCIDNNFFRFQGELETIKSEVKRKDDKYALAASRIEEAILIVKESNEDFNKKNQDIKKYMEGKFECLTNTFSTCLETSVGAIKEAVGDKIKAQMSDMLQGIKAELVSSIPALSVDVNAVKQSLEWQSKIKEMFEASITKKFGEDELQNSQLKKGMDVETMKMRIVELTSQRDAEKVFHKITRQSLRALERDHERLREEFLGARLRRDRRATQEPDPRRQFQNFISQQCSYCFNNNRARVAQQMHPPTKHEKQKSHLQVQPTASEPCSNKPEAPNKNDILKTKERSDNQHTGTKTPINPETGVEKIAISEEEPVNIAF